MQPIPTATLRVHLPFRAFPCITCFGSGLICLLCSPLTPNVCCNVVIGGITLPRQAVCVYTRLHSRKCKCWRTISYFLESACLAGAAAPTREQWRRGRPCIAATFDVRLGGGGSAAAAAAVQHYGRCCAVMRLRGVGHAACSSKRKRPEQQTPGAKAERLHLANLRRLLRVRQGTPNAVVLAEAGERPLRQRWLVPAVKLWNVAMAAERLAVAAGHCIPARQPWAQQLAAVRCCWTSISLHQRPSAPLIANKWRVIAAAHAAEAAPRRIHPRGARSTTHRV
jgi:hypothetical protein